MRKILWTLLMLGTSSAMRGLQGSQNGHMELTRMKMSLMYVRSIKTFRLLFMSLLGVGLCMVFLFTGLLLFHATLFLYSPWSLETKMQVGFLCSAIYLLATLILFYKIFAQDKWLKIFNAESIMEHLESQGQPPEEGSERMAHKN